MKLKPPTLVLTRTDFHCIAESLSYTQATNDSMADNAHQRLIEAIYSVLNNEMEVELELDE